MQVHNYTCLLFEHIISRYTYTITPILELIIGINYLISKNKEDGQNKTDGKKKFQ